MTIDMTPSALSDRIKVFFKRYKRDGMYPYIEDIDLMGPEDRTHVVVDFNDLTDDQEFGMVIADTFIEDPDMVLEALARAIRETLQERFSDLAKQIGGEITARIVNFPLKKRVREISSSSSGKFITISGMVVRMSTVGSIPKVATFACPDGHLTTVNANRNHSITEPDICRDPNCKYIRKDLEIVGAKSVFTDYQIVQMQELPSELPPGNLPRTMGVFVTGDLVDSTRMGDTVEISGVVRAEIGNEINLGKRVRTYNQRLYANSIKTVSAENNFGGEISDVEMKRMEVIKEMDEKDAMRMLVRSFAPHIYGHEIIKESLILTMVGGDSITMKDGTRVRGDINIFLVGDPGTGKSELGKAVYRIAPRAFYASGRGSSGAGLTAATIQDKTTGAFMLEPGVTVLADQGTAVIDEFDKMKTEDRSALHEVMEQQTASISKGGITATLNARASIVAIANPIHGKYDVNKNLTENVTLPIPLLTRFDLIFVILDRADPEKDEKIAGRIASSHREEEEIIPDGHHFPPDLLAKYLRVAKGRRPRFSKEAEGRLKQYYLKMRNDDEDMYTITPRQFEGLIRLSTAHSKALLKDMVDENDAERAIEIMEEMFQSSGVDVNTGKVDPGVLAGKPKSEIPRTEKFQSIMRELDERDGSGNGVKKSEIISEMVESGMWDEDKAHSMFARMWRDGVVYESSSDRYRLVGGGLF